MLFVRGVGPLRLAGAELAPQRGSRTGTGTKERNRLD